MCSVPLGFCETMVCGALTLWGVGGQAPLEENFAQYKVNALIL